MIQLERAIDRDRERESTRETDRDRQTEIERKIERETQQIDLGRFFFRVLFNFNYGKLK